MKDLLLPCSVEFSEESSEKSSPIPPSVDMKEVQDVMDSVLDRLSENEKMEETNQNNVKKELTETEEMIHHILVENVVTKALDEGFIRGLIFKAADFAVGESFANSMSSKKQSRGGASASFLSEVPLHLIESAYSKLLPPYQLKQLGLSSFESGLVGYLQPSFVWISSLHSERS